MYAIFQKRFAMIACLEDEWNEEWFLLMVKHFQNNICWDYLSRNPNVTMKLMQKYPEYPWNQQHFSLNKSITIDDIVNNLDFPWDWDSLSHNKNITLDIALNNFQDKWNWSLIRYNQQPNTFYYIWYDISFSATLTIETINKNLDRFNWNILCKNPTFTLEIAKTFANECQDYWHEISANSNITFETILANPDLPWNWENVSRNPTLSLKYVMKRPEIEWNFHHICENPFTADKQAGMQRKIKSVLLATIHEHHMENVDYKKEICTNLAEHVLLDCFLVKLLMQY